MKQIMKSIDNEIPIEAALEMDEDGRISARKLYEFLELAPSQFSRWAKRNLVNNNSFSVNVDFWGPRPMVADEKTGRLCDDYLVTPDVAKELAMLAHNEKGRQVRDYFSRKDSKLEYIVASKAKEIEDVHINNAVLPIRSWNGERVVTFADIDRVHELADGTARRNFDRNKRYFVKGEDYFLIRPKDLETRATTRRDNLSHLNISANTKGTMYLTESGYLMVAKSLQGDLAWEVQRRLVNTYFKVKTGEFVTMEQVTKLFSQIQGQLDSIQNNCKVLEDNCKANFEANEKTRHLVGTMYDDLNPRLSVFEMASGNVPWGKKSKWFRERAKEISDMAAFCGVLTRKLYCEIFERMESDCGIVFGMFKMEFHEKFPSRKQFYDLDVIEWFDLKEAFDDAEIKVGRSYGFFQEPELPQCFVNVIRA